MEKYIISISQLGYKPSSVKTATLICNEDTKKLPDEIPFYIQAAGDRLLRNSKPPKGWNGNFFSWPFEIGKGNTKNGETNEGPTNKSPIFKGHLKKTESRWGILWQGDFSHFEQEGSFQIETEYQISVPFRIHDNIFERIIWGYLVFINAQRSGFNNPGIRDAQHLDDGKLDIDGTQINAAGGWYDAGDYRKWMTLTQGNLETLCMIANSKIPEFKEKALDEIKWGNRFFHAMINEEGRIYEDIGGGDFKQGLSFEKDWWFENHPGCNSNNAGNYHTNNIPGSGDERIVRTSYNPLAQFQFVNFQAQAALVLKDEEAIKCKNLALKAWQYGINKGHDDRTLFLSTQILAAISLYKLSPGTIDKTLLKSWGNQLVERQFPKSDDGISGFFMEDGGNDGYRSIAFSSYPSMAILRAYDFFQNDLEMKTKLSISITTYIEDYLLADAKTNPFHIVPYGIFIKPVNPEYQTYRKAGGKNFIRTFIAPISHQEIIHGTNSVLTAHAGYIAEAARILDKNEWIALAEEQIHWSLGHNPHGLSLFGGIGYKHPVAYSTVHNQIPEAPVVGYIGTPEDIPYIETSNWLEWCTQEMWDVPYYGAVQFALNI